MKTNLTTMALLILLIYSASMTNKKLDTFACNDLNLTTKVSRRIIQDDDELQDKGLQLYESSLKGRKTKSNNY